MLSFLTFIQTSIPSSSKIDTEKEGIIANELKSSAQSQS